MLGFWNQLDKQEKPDSKITKDRKTDTPADSEQTKTNPTPNPDKKKPPRTKTLTNLTPGAPDSVRVRQVVDVVTRENFRKKIAAKTRTILDKKTNKTPDKIKPPPHSKKNT